MVTHPGSSAIVSGGARGIGFACVRALAEAGFAVTFTGRDPTRLQAAERELATLGGPSPRGVAVEAASADETAELVERATSQTGRLDVVVANAGIYLGKTIEETSPEEWDEVISANLNGVFLLLKAALPHLRRSSGLAVAIGSVSGTRGFGDEAAYGASKRALRILTESIVAEAGADGVRATLISPGVVRTRMAASIFGSAYGEDADTSGPLVVDDIAATIRYLLSLSSNAVVNEIVLNDTRWIHDPDWTHD